MYKFLMRLNFWIKIENFPFNKHLTLYQNIDFYSALPKINVESLQISLIQFLLFLEQVEVNFIYIIILY